MDLETAATYVEKGGVGKTTTAAHIAVAAHRDHDRDVLLVDLAGVQNDLATHFGHANIVEDIDAPISTVFGDDWEFVVDNVPNILDRMTFSTGEGPDLIPADPGLGGADNNLANVPIEERYSKLRAFLEELVADEYDIVIFDLPGKEDNIALNGLWAAQNVIAPLRPGKFEQQQLDRLDETIAELADELDVPIQLLAVVPTVIDNTTNLSEEFVRAINENYGNLATDSVTKTADIGTAQNHGSTLFALDDDDLYTTGQRARDQYRTVTDTIISRLQ